MEGIVTPVPTSEDTATSDEPPFSKDVCQKSPGIILHHVIKDRVHARLKTSKEG